MTQPYRVGVRLRIEDLRPHQRVYIKNFDIFGTVNQDCTRIRCDHPMPSYDYVITPDSQLYDEF